MTTPSSPQDAPAPEPPTIHEAARAPGPSGAVLRGAELEFGAAVLRRKAGEDVVVCGDNGDEIRRLAQAIEIAVGPYLLQRFHRFAGPLALPHAQQLDRNHPGHSFYETDKRKSRKLP